MKILCTYSGVEFNCEHFPGTFYSREVCHPVFYIPLKKLLSYTGKWAAGELTPTDSYLLFLSILKSTDLVEFRVPVFKNQYTDSLIAQNMEFLVTTVTKLNAVSTPSVVFPHYVITPETRFLTNVRYWIENWAEAYKDFQSGRGRDYDNRKLLHREAALQRMIKNPHKPIRDYAAQIADWAAIAGEFPNFLVTDPFRASREKITLSDMWKLIITRCAKEEYLYTIPKSDLQELIDHCEDRIPIGSIYSNALFTLLRKAQDKQKNWLGLGDMDIKSSFEILAKTDDAETANIRAAIQSAPEQEPRPEQYPTKFLYMKAKFRWQMAKRYQSPDSGTDSNGES
jgi:hypothetical protein